MRSLVQLLDKGNISPEMMDAKVLQVPVKGYKNRVIHASGELCPNIKVALKDKKEREFYSELEEDSSSFEYISFNDFLTNKSKYCDACLGSTSAGLDEYGLFVEDFVELLQKAEKLLTDDSFYTSDSFNIHTKWMFICDLFYNKTALENVPEYFIFVEKVFTKLKTLEYAGIDSNAVTRELADDLKYSVIPELEVTQNPAVQSALAASRESFVQALLTDTTFTLFDFSFDNLEDLDSWSIEESITLLLKVILYPTFTFGSFTVLPQVHFIWLNDFLFKLREYSTFDDFKQVTLSSLPSKETIENMKGLFQPGNAALNSYEKVYDISVNI